MYTLKREFHATTMKVKYVSMSARIFIAQRRLDCIDREGKMDRNPNSSPKIHFQKIVNEFKTESNRFRKCNSELKDAQQRLEDYEKKSGKIKLFDSKHRQLKKDVKDKMDAFMKAKEEFEKKREEVDKACRVINAQMNSIHLFKQAENMHKFLSNKDNRNFINVFPNQIDALRNSYLNNYNNSIFSMANIPNNSISRPGRATMEMFQKAVADCKRSMKKQQARDALQKFNPRQRSNEKEHNNEVENEK